MKFIFTSLIFTQILFSPLLSNLAKDQALNKISEVVHPNMAKIWEAFFANFDQDKITAWNFSEETGLFSICLKNPLQFYVPASKSQSKDPRPGSILVFGPENKVEGQLNRFKRDIEFFKGFQIHCKYKIGFISIPVTVDVYHLTYQNDEMIVLEAGRAGLSEKRSKSLEKYLSSWFNPSHVVIGDFDTYLNRP